MFIVDFINWKEKEYIFVVLIDDEEKGKKLFIFFIDLGRQSLLHYVLVKDQNLRSSGKKPSDWFDWF
jgi:hypothetical protein